MEKHGDTSPRRVDPRSAAHESDADARARLHQLREEAGGALSGKELARRFGLNDDSVENAPPLDWRLTPRNVFLQLLAVLAFGAAIWFLGSLFIDGVNTLFRGDG